jgi:lysophospholipase L1-like esterase
MPLGLNNGIAGQVNGAGLMQKLLGPYFPISDGLANASNAVPLNGRMTESGNAIWSAPSTFTTQSGKISHSGTSDEIAYINSPSPDFKAQLTVTNPAGIGLSFRGSDDNNFYELYETASNPTFNIENANVNTIYYYYNPSAANDVLTAYCHSKCINVTKNGLPWLNMTYQTFNQSATRAGVHAKGNGATVDNFSLDALPTTNRSIVCAGDSITEGSGIPNPEAYPFQLWSQLYTEGQTDLLVWNTGVSGYATTDVASIYPTEIAPLLTPGHATRIMVLFIGTNDLKGGATAAATATAVTNIVTTAKAAGVTVYVCTLMHLETLNSALETVRLAFNTLVRTNVAAVADGIIDLAADSVMGTYTSFTDNPVFWLNDIHPNYYGYNRLMWRVRAAIQGAVAAPTVTSISPTSGSNTGTTAVTITGTGFNSAPVVKVGSTGLSGVTVVSSTSITATVPSGITAGAYNVTVNNPDDQTGTLTNGFTANAASGITDNFSAAAATNYSGRTTTTGGKTWVVWYLASWTSTGSNTLQSSGAGSNENAIYVAAGATDGAVQATLTTVANNAGIVGRYLNGTGFIWISTGSNYQLYKVAGGGAYTLLGTYSVTPANGDVLKMIFSGNTITCYVNGVAASFGVITNTFNNTETGFGLRCDNGSSAARWSSFSFT